MNTRPCTKDHMHKWEMMLLTSDPHGGEWVCITEPEPAKVQDAEMSYIITNTEWVPVKGVEMLRQLVERAKKDIVADVESSVWEEPTRPIWAEPVNTDTGPPLQFSDLLKLTMDRYDHAIEQEHKRWLNSPFYKIMRERQTEICLLYGTMANYFLVMEYKPQ